ncbi:TPA: glutathione peroxidase, partial [Staphylococcus aureus]
SPIKWNFTKFIIDRQGNVVNRFLPMEDPLDISTNIEILLQESSS